MTDNDLFIDFPTSHPSEEEHDPFKVTYFPGQCQLPEPGVFYPPRSVRPYTSPSQKNSRRVQELPAKHRTFSANCFKFRFGIIFISELEGEQGFRVRCFKGKLKYSMTIKVTNNKLRWYTWKPKSGVRSYFNPIGVLESWVRRGMLLPSDPLDEYFRMQHAVAFQLFKLASITMPWVVPDMAHGAYVEDVHRLFLSMVYPNLNIRSSRLYGFFSHSKVRPELRGGAKEAAKALCGVSSPRALELLNLGVLLSYERVKYYVTPQQFLGVPWERITNIDVLPSTENTPSLHEVKDPGTRRALGKMFCADLLSCPLAPSFSKLRDAALSVCALEERGFTAKQLKVLRKNFKTLNLFDYAVGAVLGMVNSDYFEYQHVFKLPIFNVADWKIVTPSTSVELVQWGHDLGNCIGSYSDYYNRGRCLLIGLLDKEGVCLAAAEVVKRHSSSRENKYIVIQQCEGRDDLYVNTLSQVTEALIDRGELNWEGLGRAFKFDEGPSYETIKADSVIYDAVVSKIINQSKERNNARHGTPTTGLKRLQPISVRVPKRGEPKASPKPNDSLHFDPDFSVPNGYPALRQPFGFPDW